MEVIERVNVPTMCESMPSAEIPVLRIVCTTCPAVAVVHYVQPETDPRRLVWAECHGEHVLGLLPHCFRRGRDLIIADLEAISDDEIEQWHAHAEASMTKHATVANVLERFLKRRPEGLKP